MWPVGPGEVVVTLTRVTRQMHGKRRPMTPRVRCLATAVPRLLRSSFGPQALGRESPYYQADVSPSHGCHRWPVPCFERALPRW